MVRNRNQRFIPTPETIERERRALELRRAGVTLELIAEQLGYANRSVAHKAIKRALIRTLQQPADELRALEADRLDRLQTAYWAAALRGDIKAGGVVLQIMRQRAELIGLNHSHGIAERLMRLTDQQAALTLDAISRVMDGLNLTPEQHALLGHLVPEALRAVAAIEAADEGVYDADVVEDSEAEEPEEAPPTNP
ncbi:hypothetical protein [Sphaerisporangium aureirubrum]|uniref:Helix-turn-helix domain containing protein n=1 Tax=Sphaerisporangium aureirubrum TaxID=1544736 RepID=A0ABW1NDY8_9ACTN